MDYNQDFANDLFIGARANFSFADSKYELYEELDYTSAGLPWRSRIGLNLSQPFGYIAERLFIDEADVANNAGNANKANNANDSDNVNNSNDTKGNVI